MTEKVRRALELVLFLVRLSPSLLSEKFTQGFEGK